VSAAALAFAGGCRGAEPRALGAAAGDSATAAALEAVLLRREHARRVVVWRTRLDEGEPLGELVPVVRRDRVALGLPPLGAPASARPVTPAQLRLPVPVTVLGADDFATLFGRAPDGWRAFFARHPGASGVAEVSRPTAVERGAVVYVTRQCGEQCAGAFRVTVTCRPGGAWAADTVVPLPAR
jgi:hypothetical protein